MIEVLGRKLTVGVSIAPPLHQPLKIFDCFVQPEQVAYILLLASITKPFSPLLFSALAPA